MGTTVNQRAAMVVASPNFVVALANNLAFEVNIVISPVMIEQFAHRTRDSRSWVSILADHGSC
jgi:hypothetical protein